MQSAVIYPFVTEDAPSLWDKLKAQPYRFSFHQAIHVCEAMAKMQKASLYQIKSHIYLAYPPSDIQKVVDQPDQGLHLVSNILGIAGVHGPLPLPLTEYILARMKEHDYGLRDFLDLFNHRLSLMYHHTTRKHRLEYSHQHETMHPYGQVFGCLMEGGYKRGAFQYASLIWHHPRSWKGLEILLRHHMHREIRVEPYQGGWSPIPREYQARLHGRTSLGGGYALGARVWDQTRYVHIHYPLKDLADFKACLPGGSKHHLMLFWLTSYAQAKDQGVLVLDWDQVPEQALRLGKGVFLGWNSFLCSSERPWVKGSTHLRLKKSAET